MTIGNKDFDFENHFYVMGILNVTPDSFSDGGNSDTVEKALFKAEQLIKDGADIIDVGGESTRPDYVKVSAKEEIERVCPVIEKLRLKFDIPISLDTYKADVAHAGISAGAHMINDIWGLKSDSEMAGVIAGQGVPCCLVHNRTDNPYDNFMENVLSDIKESIDIALGAGIDASNIMIDPGVGFAKNLQQNLKVLHHLDMLKELGYPVLLGASRKSVIGLTLGLPVDQREEGTITTSVMGYMSGCRMFRVHDVKGNLRALKMAEAVIKA